MDIGKEAMEKFSPKKQQLDQKIMMTITYIKTRGEGTMRSQKTVAVATAAAVSD